MIKLSKYVIDYEGLSLGEHLFSFDFGGDLFLGGESGICGGSGVVEVVLRRHSSFMELSVGIVGSVMVECDRCLDEYEQAIDYSGDLVVKISHQGGEYDGDIIWLHPSDSRLDLGDWLYESIVLSLPIQRMHLDLANCNSQVTNYITGTVDSEGGE